VSHFRNFILCSLLFFGSCSTVGPTKQVSDAQDKVEKQEKKINQTQSDLAKNAEQKDLQVSSLAYGIQYSLSQVANAPVQVKTAIDLNDRVISIVGSPRLDEMEKIKGITDLLNSQISEERKRGESALSVRDKQIVSLQKKTEELDSKHSAQISQLTDQTKKLAKADDEKQATLNEMSGFMGLKAVWWGLKHFVVSCLTYIAIFAAIFLIVRVLETANPVFAAIMSVFNVAFAAVISTVKALAPNAFALCKFTSVGEKNKYKETLVEIVNVIQQLKANQKIDPSKEYPLLDVLDKLEKALDTKHKDVIEEILQEEKWKK
jgi:hypothetical protein